MILKNSELLQNTNIHFTDYDFLKLFAIHLSMKDISTIIIYYLQIQLLEFYNHPDFQFLFEGLSSKKLTAFGSKNCIDLSSAFQAAYKDGFLIPIHDPFGNLQCIIPLYTKEEIDNITSQYDEIYNLSMENLVIQLLEREKSNVLSSVRKF